MIDSGLFGQLAESIVFTMVDPFQMAALLIIGGLPSMILENSDVM